MLHSIKHRIYDSLWCEFRLRTLLKNFRSYEDAVPRLLTLLVEFVRAADIALGSVANEVHRVGWGVYVEH